MRILLTAYGPFGRIKENITERVADEIQKNWNRESGELTVLKLPVLWASAEALLVQALKESAPDLVVSMGHAEGYPAITIETRYFNIAGGEDNRSETRKGGVIDHAGEDSYDTNIDAEGLALYLGENDVAAVLHSGKEGMNYLCNFAGYIVMRHIRSAGRKKPLFIFLHLPPDVFPFSTLVRGVTEVINFLALKAQQ